MLFLVAWLQLCKHESEREEESADFKNMYSPRSPSPSLTRTGGVWSPPPCHPGACLSVFHVLEVHACTALTISRHCCWRYNSDVDSAWSWKGAMQVWCVGVRSGVRSWVTGGRVWLWGVRVWLGGRWECSVVAWEWKEAEVTGWGVR